MKRDDIAQAIKEALDRISTASGYNTDPALVLVGSRDFEELMEYPSLFVAPKDEEVEELMGSSGSINSLRVEVVGLTNEPLSPDKGLQDLMEDVAAALEDENYQYRDRTVMEAVTTDASILAPAGRFVLTLHVTYLGRGA